jgi:hypothetical protein
MTNLLMECPCTDCGPVIYYGLRSPPPEEETCERFGGIPFFCTEWKRTSARINLQLAVDACWLAGAGIMTVFKRQPMYQCPGFDSEDKRFNEETKYNWNRLVGWC